MEKQVHSKSLAPFFILSGMTGLMYGLSWIRESMLIFGATFSTITMVMALFFCGITIGNICQLRKPKLKTLQALGFIELAMCISGILSIVLFEHIRHITPGVYSSLSNSENLFALYRTLAIALTIGLPSLFLGMSFPVMVAIVSTPEKGEIASAVYGLNILGAVIGTVVTGLLLLPKIGMSKTILVAAIINAVVAIRFLRCKTRNRDTAMNESSRVKLFPAVPLLFILGFCGMASLIIWNRLLPLIIDTSLFSFSSTIAAVLFGIAIGSFVFGKVGSKDHDYSKVFGTVIIFNLTFFLVAVYLPAPIWQMIGAIDSEYLSMLVIASIIFIPSFFMGAAFPVAIKMAGVDTDSGRVTGILSASISMGSVLGSIVAGFFLINQIGISGTAVGISIMMGTIVVISFVDAQKVRARWMLLLLPCIVIAIFYRNQNQFIKDFVGNPTERVEYIKEGTHSTVSVTSNPSFKSVKIDNVVQGESRKNRFVMTAHLPMLLSGNPKKVVVIGAGTGAIARRFSLYPIDSLDLVDPEPALFAAMKRHFETDWMNKAGFHTVVADGQFYVTNTTKSYDVIAINAGNVFQPNVSRFYTEDFYRTSYKHLTQDGVISQCIPMASFDKKTFQRAIASFIAVFPTSQLWYNKNELILIGFKGKEYNLVSKKVDHFLSGKTSVYHDLAINHWGGDLFNLNSRTNLAGGFLANGTDLKRMTEGAVPFSSSTAELENITAVSPKNTPFISEIAMYFSPVEYIVPDVSMTMIRSIEQLRKVNVENVFADELTLKYQQSGDVQFLDKALEYNDKNVIVHRLLGEYSWKINDLESAEKHFTRVFAQDPGSTDAGIQIALVRLKKEDTKGAVDILFEILSDNPKNIPAHILMGGTLTQMGNFEIARHHLDMALQLEPGNPEALRNLKYLNTLTTKEQ